MQFFVQMFEDTSIIYSFWIIWVTFQISLDGKHDWMWLWWNLIADYHLEWISGWNLVQDTLSRTWMQMLMLQQSWIYHTQNIYRSAPWKERSSILESLSKLVSHYSYSFFMVTSGSFSTPFNKYSRHLNELSRTFVFLQSLSQIENLNRKVRIKIVINNFT